MFDVDAEVLLDVMFDGTFDGSDKLGELAEEQSVVIGWEFIGILGNKHTTFWAGGNAGLVVRGCQRLSDSNRDQIVGSLV